MYSYLLLYSYIKLNFNYLDNVYIRIYVHIFIEQ